MPDNRAHHSRRTPNKASVAALAKAYERGGSRLWIVLLEGLFRSRDLALRLYADREEAEFRMGDYLMADAATRAGLMPSRLIAPHGHPQAFPKRHHAPLTDRLPQGYPGEADAEAFPRPDRDMRTQRTQSSSSTKSGFSGSTGTSIKDCIMGQALGFPQCRPRLDRSLTAIVAARRTQPAILRSALAEAARMRLDQRPDGLGAAPAAGRAT
jgi:hypothetical protein